MENEKVDEDQPEEPWDALEPENVDEDTYENVDEDTYDQQKHDGEPWDDQPDGIDGQPWDDGPEDAWNDLGGDGQPVYGDGEGISITPETSETRNISN